MDPKKLMARLVEQINARISIRNGYADDLEQARSAEVPDEASITALREKQAAVDAELIDLDARREALAREIEDDERVARLQAITSPTSAPQDQRERTGSAQVTEPRTYSRESDPQGVTFLRDVARAAMGNYRAQDRLRAHEREERTERGDEVFERAVTGDGSPGTIVPQYLLDMYTPKGRPGRRFADQCRAHPLPPGGLRMDLPRQTAKTAVGLQAAELDTVTESDYDDEVISVPVRTAAGSQTISRQFAERGTGGDEIVFEDMLRAYDSDLDSLLLNSATWGLLAVATAVTYTDADPTAQELYRKILGSGAAIEDVLEDLDEADLFTLMRGSRWKWLQGEFSDKFPFIAQPGFGPLAVGGSNGEGYKSAVRGSLPNGGAVVTDNNLPKNLGTGTNQDTVVVVSRQEAHLWEDPAAPLFIRAEQSQVKKLGIDLVVYGYFAAYFNRVPGAHQKITGTGLVPPVF